TRAGLRHRILRELLLSGAQRRGHGRDDLPDANSAVVDAAAGDPIYLSPRRRRPQQRWKLPAECLGDRASLRTQLLTARAGRRSGTSPPVLGLRADPSYHLRWILC